MPNSLAAGISDNGTEFYWTLNWMEAAIFNASLRTSRTCCKIIAFGRLSMQRGLSKRLTQKDQFTHVCYATVRAVL